MRRRGFIRFQKPAEPPIGAGCGDRKTFGIEVTSQAFSTLDRGIRRMGTGELPAAPMCDQADNAGVCPHHGGHHSGSTGFLLGLGKTISRGVCPGKGLTGRCNPIRTMAFFFFFVESATAQGARPP